MKVLVISSVFVPTRIAEADHAYHSCAELARRGIGVHVLTSEIPDNPTGNEFNVMPVMPDWSWRQLPRLLRVIKTVSPDAVLLFYLPSLYRFSLMVACTGTYLKWMFPRANFVVVFSNVGTGSGLKSVKRLVARWVGKYKYGTLLTTGTKIIYLAEYHRDRLLELYPALRDKLVWCPTPALMKTSDRPPEAARAAGRLAVQSGKDDLLIAYFGRIYPEKGIETLIEAFSRVSGRHPDARLIMIGGQLDRRDIDQYAQTLDRKVFDLALAGKVFWTGEYDWDSDLGSLCLHASDICVLPFDEGVSLMSSSLSAASAHGLPIVTTGIGTLESPLADEQNVLICPPRNPEAMAAAILKVIADGPLRERLSKGAEDLYRNHLNRNAATEVIVAALSDKR
jgi:glycosyltransferase involved in cell wall biosynthesis